MPNHFNIASNQYLKSGRFDKYVAENNIQGASFYWLNTGDPGGHIWFKSHDIYLSGDYSSRNHFMDHLMSKVFSNSNEPFVVQVGGKRFRLVNDGDARRLLASANQECLPLLKPMIKDAFPQLLEKMNTYLIFG